MIKKEQDLEYEEFIDLNSLPDVKEFGEDIVKLEDSFAQSFTPYQFVDPGLSTTAEEMEFSEEIPSTDNDSMHEQPLDGVSEHLKCDASVRREIMTLPEYRKKTKKRGGINCCLLLDSGYCVYYKRRKGPLLPSAISKDWKKMDKFVVHRSQFY